MNKLYRLYFYLRFWVAQATKKFIEFISGDLTGYTTEVNSFPTVDTSNTFDIITTENITVINGQESNSSYILSIIFDDDFNVTSNVASQVNYELGSLTYFEANFSSGDPYPFQDDITFDAVSDFQVTMTAQQSLN